MKTNTLVVLLFSSALTAATASAQPAPFNEIGVTMGHWHIVSKDVEANKKLFLAMGGKLFMPGGNPLIMFPGLYINLVLGTEKGDGGTEGSVMNHVGFIVNNVQERVAQWKAAGVAVLPGNNNRLDQAFVVTPDGVRIEILEDKTQPVAIRNEHVHLSLPEAEIPKAQAWYAKTFGGKTGTRNGAPVVDLPGRTDPVRHGGCEAGGDQRTRARPHRFRREGSCRLREEDRGARHQARRAGSQECRRQHHHVHHRSVGYPHRDRRAGTVGTAGAIRINVPSHDMNSWTRWLPGLQILSRYEASWLPHDLMAGLVLTTMLVPVGIAYAVASGVPGINGLYATIVPLLAYALFGPSRILVLGPDSSLAAVILAVVAPLSGGDPLRAVAVASMMAVVTGLVCILVGIMRLGFVTELLSKPIRYGYMNGIALTVLISQLPKLFGFSIDGVGPLRDLVKIAQSVSGGQVNWTAFAVGAVTLAVILLLKPYKRVPGILIAVVGATVAVGVLGLDREAGVKVLGPLPQGLPSFALPWTSFADLSQVVIGGCAVAMVAFADTSVLSRTYAARTRTSGRSEPGNDRSGRRQPGCGTVPGVCDQQQLIAHTRRRSRRRKDATHRRGWRGGGRVAPAAGS